MVEHHKLPQELQDEIKLMATNDEFVDLFAQLTKEDELRKEIKRLEVLNAKYERTVNADVVKEQTRFKDKCEEYEERLEGLRQLLRNTNEALFNERVACSEKIKEKNLLVSKVTNQLEKEKGEVEFLRGRVNDLVHFCIGLFVVVVVWGLIGFAYHKDTVALNNPKPKFEAWVTQEFYNKCKVQLDDVNKKFETLEGEFSTCDFALKDQQSQLCHCKGDLDVLTQKYTSLEENYDLLDKRRFGLQQEVNQLEEKAVKRERVHKHDMYEAKRACDLKTENMKREADQGVGVFAGLFFFSVVVALLTR